MSPSDPRVNISLAAQNRMGHSGEPPESVPHWEAELQRRIGRERNLIRAAGQLFGDALADSLLRALDDVADATDSLSLATSSLRAEGENSAGAAQHYSDELDELAKVLDLETIREPLRRRYGTYAAERSDYPTLLMAAEHNRSERVRLFTELEAARKSIEEMSDEQDAIITASANEVQSYQDSLTRLLRQGKITYATRHRIIAKATEAIS